jgi:hypothetical protein
VFFKCSLSFRFPPPKSYKHFLSPLYTCPISSLRYIHVPFPLSFIYMLCFLSPAYTGPISSLLYIHVVFPLSAIYRSHFLSPLYTCRVSCSSHSASFYRPNNIRCWVIHYAVFSSVLLVSPSPSQTQLSALPLCSLIPSSYLPYHPVL